MITEHELPDMIKWNFLERDNRTYNIIDYVFICTSGA